MSKFNYTPQEIRELRSQSGRGYFKDKVELGYVGGIESEYWVKPVSMKRVVKQMSKNTKIPVYLNTVSHISGITGGSGIMNNYLYALGYTKTPSKGVSLVIFSETSKNSDETRSTYGYLYTNKNYTLLINIGKKTDSTGEQSKLGVLQVILVNQKQGYLNIRMRDDIGLKYMWNSEEYNNKGVVINNLDELNKEGKVKYYKGFDNKFTEDIDKAFGDNYHAYVMQNIELDLGEFL